MGLLNPIQLAQVNKIAAVNAKTTAKAWVNFNGTGTVAIRSSYNVSSITDNGTGNYTINFITPMNDDKFTLAGICSNNTIGSGNATISEYSAGARTINLIRVYTARSNAYLDIPVISIIIFGD